MPSRNGAAVRALDLVSLQAERRWSGCGRQNRFSVIETSRGARGEIAVVTSRNIDGNYSLSDAIEVNANIYCPGRGQAAVVGCGGASPGVGRGGGSSPVSGNSGEGSVAPSTAR